MASAANCRPSIPTNRSIKRLSLQVPIVYIGVGAERESLIVRHSMRCDDEEMATERDDEEEEEEDKENFEDSRDDTSTFLTSSARVENEEAVVNSEGFLDLSHQNLTNLSRHLSEQYANVRRLDVSGNAIKTFSYMKMFGKCEILAARNCQINKFAADFNYNLKELHLAGNQLKQASQMCRFENLTLLDLSRNFIKEHIVLTFKKLEVLNLSTNALTKLPDLSNCPALRSLDVSENQISDLENIAHQICPTNLTFLSISSNSIADLSQFSLMSSFRKLTNLNIAHNPCISDLEQFDHRPYIVACCSENLEQVDDELIEDHVRTEGEWLAIQGGIRKIAAGNHWKLCERLTSHFPKNEDGPPTPAQKSCQKALEKRRESSGPPTTVESDRTVNSVYSPFREWNGKMTTPVKRDLRMCSPPEASKNKSFTFRNENARKSLDPPLELPYPRPLTFSRTNSTDTVILSSRTELSISVDGRSESTPLPIVYDDPPQNTSDENPESTTPIPAHHRTPSVADVSVLIEEHDGVSKRVDHLEKSVAELTRQNRNLTAINQELVEMLEAFKSEQEKMWEVIRSSIPKPQELKSSLLDESEDGLQTHIVSWTMPVVRGYEIHVDGNSCGQVVGKRNTARITDLDPDKPHSVQIQAIGLNGIRGELSQKLHIQLEDQ
uniref:Fibronectin type-III domain-containing protein n=2 Tax=Caenorhabditis japonica TaxID=281687 RepID=A0A8R1HUX5_CAEJA